MPPFSPEIQPVQPKQTAEQLLGDRIDRAREELYSLAREYTELYADQDMSHKPPKELLALFAEAVIKVGGFTAKQAKSKDVLQFLNSAWYEEYAKKKEKASEVAYDAIAETFPRGKKYEPGVHEQDVAGATDTVLALGGDFGIVGKIRGEFLSRDRVLTHLKETKPAVFARFEQVMQQDLPDVLRQTGEFDGEDNTLRELVREDIEGRLQEVSGSYLVDLKKGILLFDEKYKSRDIPIATAIDSQEQLLEDPKLMDEEVKYEKKKRKDELRQAQFAAQFMARLRSSAAGRAPSLEAVAKDPQLKEIERVIESAPKEDVQEIAHFHSKQDLKRSIDRMRENYLTALTVKNINQRIRVQMRIPSEEQSDSYHDFFSTLERMLAQRDFTGNFDQAYDMLVRSLLSAEKQAALPEEELKKEVRQKAEGYLRYLKKQWIAKKDLEAITSVPKQELLALIAPPKKKLPEYSWEESQKKEIERIYSKYQLEEEQAE